MASFREGLLEEEGGPGGGGGYERTIIFSIIIMPSSSPSISYNHHNPSPSPNPNLHAVLDRLPPCDATKRLEIQRVDFSSGVHETIGPVRVRVRARVRS